VLERAAILAGEGTIEIAHLAPGFGGTPAPRSTRPGEFRMRLGTTLEEAELGFMRSTLQPTGNDKTRAAEILGISQKTLFKRLKE
jgi:DNA-binding NtrC family response regulator